MKIIVLLVLAFLVGYALLKLFEEDDNKKPQKTKTSNSTSNSKREAINTNSSLKNENESSPKIQMGQLKNGILTLWDNTTELNDVSLEEYKHLKKIIFPASLTTLESTVIYDQEQLEEIDFSKVTKLKEIPEDFISGEHKICKFIIPDGVEIVGDGFMGDAKAGTQVFVPKSVQKLGCISGTSNNDLIVYLYAAGVNIEEAEPDIKTLYVLPQDIAQYAKQLKECDSEVQLREMPEEKRNLYNSTTGGYKRAVNEMIKHETVSPNNQQKGKTLSSNDNMETMEEREGRTYDSEGNIVKIIPAGTEVIGNEFDSYGIKKIVLPSSAKKISDEAFQYSSFLEEVDLSQCKSLESIGRYAFNECEQLKEVDLSQCKSLESIGEAAFQKCYKLEKINLISKSLESIGKWAFNKCKQFEKINLRQCQSLKSIGEGAFYGCEQLKEVDLSQCESLETIGDKAFDECNLLKEVDLSQCKALKTIVEKAFSSCKQLEKINLSQCESLEAIGDCAFDNCYLLKEVDLSQCKALKTIGVCAFRDCKQLEIINLSQSLESIGNSAFSSCKQLKEIDLCQCKALKTIGERAFSNCEQLEKVDLSQCKALKTIGVCAFSNCEQLKEVDLNQCESLETIGERAFSKTGIKVLDFSQCAHLKSLGGRLDSDEYYLSGGTKCNANIVIEQIIFPPLLEEIPANFCRDIETLERVDLSHSTQLKRIGEAAFYKLPNLKELLLPDSIEVLGKWAFCSIDKLKEIIMPASLKEMQYGVFMESELTSIDFSKVTSLTTIPECAFDGCDIQSIELPDCVEVIEKKAFEDCQKLREIIMPASLKEIGPKFFSSENNGRLKKIDFSKVTLLETIPEDFINDNNIKTLTIPKGVKNIEYGAFNVNKLEKLFLPPTLESFDSFNHWDLDLYCFSPKLEELEPLVDDLSEGKQLRLHVLPQYLSTYVKQRDAEGVSEEKLSIQEIPAEYLNYYDN